MVFYYYPRGYVDGTRDFLIYVGRDKHENEELITYGLPTDIWFHVEDLSSAHVYLRLPDGCGIDDIPQETLEDCVQLVKANSIQGCKKASVAVIYTPWTNLHKTPDMAAGAVGFHSMEHVRHTTASKKVNEIINRLNRTKKEMSPDLKAEKEEYEDKIRAVKKAELVQQKKEEKTKKDEEKMQSELKSYSTLMQEEHMVSNKSLSKKYKNVEDFEEDFM